MKNIIKNERGVSLVSLAVAVIILGIITSMLLYNVKDTKDIERVSNMYIDIEGISDRVSNYYSRYGALPIMKNIDLSSDSTIIEWISERDSSTNEGPLGKNDSDNFYVIDLNALENLSLNYGSGFNRNTLPSDKDVYVINENSHNIFYLHGIKVSSGSGTKWYYTNQEKDTEAVDIRYFAGIRIPDGYSFKSGTTKNDLVIEDSLNNEYTWANTADGAFTMTKTGDDYYITDTEENTTKLVLNNGNGQNVEDLIASAKEFEGFYYNTTTGNVNYFSIAEEDNWGQAYDITATYTDRNGDTAYIPKGFKISKLSSLNTINKGLVIKNEETEDEYVWIDVPDNVLSNARTLDEIEIALQNYAADYRKEGFEDTWYDGCGLTRIQYNELKNKMLQSIKENGGFYIGRYEAGVSKTNPRTSGTSATTIESLISESGVPTSQKDKYPYNYVTVNQAQWLSQKVKPTNADYETSLMFGIQWDLVCKFLEETGEKTYDEIVVDSTEWGNYNNSEVIITSNNAMKASWTNISISWTNISKGSTKEKNKSIVLTSGASENNKTLNIYDFAGNTWEWTLEHTLNQDTSVCTGRSGDYSRISGTNGSAAYRYYNTTSYTNPGISFRVTLFK